MDSIASRAYLINESLAEEEKSLRLRLPSADLVQYEEEDIEFLSRINNEDDFASLVQDYILGTVSECVRIIEDDVLGTLGDTVLQFCKSSYLCSAHRARWDIFTMVCFFNAE